MARAIPDLVLSDEIRLEEWDPKGDTYIKFQRPSRWEQEQLDKMQARSVLEFDTDERGRVTQRDRVPLSVLESEMVSMCLVECNLPAKQGSDKPLFVPGKTCRMAGKKLGTAEYDGFYEAWHMPNFPPELAAEIVKRLQEWHPDFDWRTPEAGER